MTNIFKGNHYYDEAKKMTFNSHPLLTMLIFVGMFFGTTIAQFLIVIPGSIVLSLIFGTENQEAYDAWGTVISLLSTAAPAALVIVYCLFAEKRSAYSMGLTKKNFGKNYLIGAIIGFAAFSAATFLCVFTGDVKYIGTDYQGNIPFIICMCIGWLIQGAEEEILCRGWLMTTLSTRMPMWAAVILNSVVFAALHLMNNGINLLSIVNLTLVGIVFSLIAVRFDSLIPSCAFHSLWNLVQGNFYGLAVSGNECGGSVFRFEITGTNELLSGGTFGIEGGLATTIVNVIMIILLVAIPKKNTESK